MIEITIKKDDNGNMYYLTKGMTEDMIKDLLSEATEVFRKMMEEEETPTTSLLTQAEKDRIRDFLASERMAVKGLSIRMETAWDGPILEFLHNGDALRYYYGEDRNDFSSLKTGVEYTLEELGIK